MYESAETQLWLSNELPSVRVIALGQGSGAEGFCNTWNGVRFILNILGVSYFAVKPEVS